MTPAVLRWCCFKGVPENATLGANRLTRRRSKNIGGRIAPAAIGGLIEARLCSVNAFGPAFEPNKCPAKLVKVLARLNFWRSPFKPDVPEGK